MSEPDPRHRDRPAASGDDDSEPPPERPAEPAAEPPSGVDRTTTPPYEGPAEGAIDLDAPASARPRRPWVTIGVAEPMPPPGRRPRALLVVGGVGALSLLLWAAYTWVGQEPTAPPEPAPAPIRHGTLTVESTPAGASVELNGRPVGTAPVTLPGLRTGGYALRLTLDGHEPIDARARIRADRTTTVHRQLYPADRERGPTGVLHLTSEPSCEVLYRGRSLGRTPLRGARLPEGVVALELVTPEGERHRRGVMIAAGDVTSTHVDLSQPVPGP